MIHSNATRKFLTITALVVVVSLTGLTLIGWSQYTKDQSAWRQTYIKGGSK